jgi:uncharacterized membrane protein
MFDSIYRRRLERDLPKWREAGWVTSRGADAILDSIEVRPAISLAALIGTLGALLLGAGIVAFVSANWDGIPHIGRFGLLVLGMAVAYLAAAIFGRRQLRSFAEAAVMVGGLTFAAAIALIGQTYHLSGEYADAVLLWEIGIFAAVLFLGSPTMVVLGLIGAGYWTWLVSVEQGMAPHWAGLIPVVIGMLAATWLDSRNARIVAVLALIFWAAVTIVATAAQQDWSYAGTSALAACVAFAVFALGVVLASFEAWPRISALGETLLWPAIVAALVALGFEQAAELQMLNERAPLVLSAGAMAAAVLLAALAFFRRDVRAIDFILLAALCVAALAFALAVPADEFWSRLAGGAMVLVASLWVVGLGHAGSLPGGKTTGLAAFGIEIVYLYAVTLGTLLDTAVAFLGGGVLFVILAFILYRIDRRLRAKPEEATP